MNNFHLVVEFIKAWFNNDPDVNTVTHGATQITDDNKKNLFPIAHFNIVSSPVEKGSDLFTFEIAVLDQRTAPTEVITDKFYKIDNELDNLNLCHAILSRFVQHITTQNDEENDISYTTITDMLPLFYKFTNGLDGWGISITFSIPKNKINVC